MEVEDTCIAPEAECNAPDALSEKCTAPSERCTAPARPKTTDEAIEVGRRLLGIKATMRGEFKRWIETECPFSYRAAANWMNAAREADAATGPERRSRDPELACFAPTRFVGTSTLTPGECHRLLHVVSNGVDPETRFKSWGQMPRLAGGVALCMAELTHARFDDLLEAAVKAKLALTAALLEVDELIDFAVQYPLDGVISSCPKVAEVDALAAGTGDDTSGQTATCPAE